MRVGLQYKQYNTCMYRKTTTNQECEFQSNEILLCGQFTIKPLNPQQYYIKSNSLWLPNFMIDRIVSTRKRLNLFYFSFDPAVKKGKILTECPTNPCICLLFAHPPAV